MRPCGRYKESSLPLLRNRSPLWMGLAARAFNGAAVQRAAGTNIQIDSEHRAISSTIAATCCIRRMSPRKSRALCSYAMFAQRAVICGISMAIGGDHDDTCRPLRTGYDAIGRGVRDHHRRSHILWPHRRRRRRSLVENARGLEPAPRAQQKSKRVHH